MNRLKAIGLGVLLGLTCGTLYVCAETDRMVEDLDKQIAAYSIEESVPFAEQIKADEDRLFQEYIENVSEEEVKTVPYDSIPISDDLQIYLQERCAEKEISFWLMVALMESESQFRSDAKGDSSKSVGLMQINACWWEIMKDAGVDVFTDKGNIEAALLIMQDYLTRGYTELEALQFYKCGESRGKELLNNGVIISGAKDVLARAEEWENENK